MSLLSRARRLANSLDASNPSCCPLCFELFAEDLDEHLDVIEELRKDCHDLWNGLVNLIAEPQNNLQTPADGLSHKVVECPLHTGSACRKRYAALSAVGTPSTPVNVLLEAGLQILDRGLSNGTRSAAQRVENRNKSFANRSGPPLWPTHPEELIPTGANLAVSTLVWWCARPDCLTYPMLVLGSYLRIARDHVFPELLCGPLVVDALVLRLARNADAPRSAAGFRLDHRAPEILMAAMLLRIIYNGQNAAPDDMDRFVRGREARLLPAVEAALRLVDRGSGHPFSILTTYALALRARLGLPANQESPYAGMGVVLLLRHALRALGTSRRCGRLGCAARDDGARFAVCATCRMLRYCTRECQRRDWRAGEPARHKILCPLLCKAALGEVAQPRGNGQIDVRFASEELETDDLLHLCRYVLARGLLETDLVPRMQELVSALRAGTLAS